MENENYDFLLTEVFILGFLNNHC